jgi:hypothetical protein
MRSDRFVRIVGLDGLSIRFHRSQGLARHRCCGSNLPARRRETDTLGGVATRLRGTLFFDDFSVRTLTSEGRR